MKQIVVLGIFIFCSTWLQAQVLVSEEPRHVPVFENEHIRILDVLLPPGDTTQYHKHALPSVFVCFSTTTMQAQLFGKEVTESTSAPGYMWFENLAPPHSKVHRVWNTDTTSFHVMDIELLSTDSGFREKPLAHPQLQVAIDTPWVRTYTLSLEVGKPFVLTTKNPSVLVAIDTAFIALQKAAKAEMKNVAPGTFFWIPAGQPVALKNLKTGMARFALIEVH